MTETNIHHMPRIGMHEAMRLFGMTARALRFYDEKGLVKAQRDRRNVRYFDAVARQRLAWISRLRACGVSLDEIRGVLAAEDLDGRGRECAVATLERRREELRLALQRVEESLGAVQALGGGEPLRLRRFQGG